MTRTLCLSCSLSSFLACAVDVTPPELPRWIRVVDRNDQPVAGAGVRLITVDDTGAQVGQLDAGITGEMGLIEFDLNASPGASVMVVADLPGGQLRGFYAGGTHDVPVHPLTDGMARLILAITATAGGRSLSDFTSDDLRAITDAIFELDHATFDLHDEGLVDAVLRATVGRQIAEASGGAIGALPSAVLTPAGDTGTATFAVDTFVCSIGAPVHVLDGSQFRFDIEEDGTLCGGSSPDLSPILAEGALSLRFFNERFYGYGSDAFPAPGVGSSPVENDREIRLGPFPLVRPSMSESDPPEPDDLVVSRKVYVPPGGDYVRYLEILDNPGPVERVIDDLEVALFLATGNDSALLTFDRDDGSNTPSAADRFVVAHDAFGDAPSAAFIFQDNRAPARVFSLYAPELAGGDANEISARWRFVTVPAGGRRAFLHYTLLSSSRSPEELHAQALALAHNPDMDGMALDEITAVVNFRPARGNVVGDAGAVIGDADVTASNTVTGQSYTLPARGDGSFHIAIDAAPGTPIRVTASDGLDATLTP